MKVRVVLFLLVSIMPAVAGLEKYAPLVKGDPPVQIAARLHHGVRITYLGTNAYLFESRDAVILVDPYFSRQSLFRTALKREPIRETGLINQWLREHPRIDAVLVTHGHVDHLFDVPPIARATGAKVITSPTSIRLVESAGVPARQLRTVRPGSTVPVRGAMVHVLPATHDRVLGSTPFPNPVKNLPPRQIDDWVLAEPLAFLIEIGGKKIFVNSGGRGDTPVQLRTGPIDLAIVGVASPDAIAAFPDTIAQLRPRYFLPSHQDNFFQPLSRGFNFLPLTDFPAVRQAAARTKAELILLDYFKPWTLR